MKIRDGFVSNSSSSSFIVFAKNDTLRDFLTEKFDIVFACIADDEGCHYYGDEKKDKKKTWGYVSKDQKKCLDKILEEDSDYDDDEYPIHRFEFDFSDDDNYQSPENYKQNFCPRIDSIDKLEKYFDFKIPEKYNERIKEYFDKGFHAFYWDIPDGGEGGNWIQSILRSNMTSIYNTNHEFEIIDDESFYFENEKDKKGSE